MSMKKFEEIVNKEFQVILRSNIDPKDHKFFNVYNWWTKIMVPNISFVDPILYKDFTYDPSVDLSKIKTVDNCKLIPTKNISSKKLNEINKYINNRDNDNFDEILKKIDILDEYNLPSTIKSLNKGNIFQPLREFENIPHENINVIIVGAGPIGLYTALYLNEYYNKSHMMKYHVNILVLDNRIKREGYRLPFSRVTQFGFDYNQIQPFLHFIPCWKNKFMSFEYGQFDYINTLEKLLYLSAFNENIPMYFTQKLEDFDELKKFAIKNNFKYVFDCTGGRLNVNFSIDPEIKWNDYSLKKGNCEVKYIGNNKFVFFVDGEQYSHITVVLHLFDKNMKNLKFGNIFGYITDNKDYSILKKYEGKCFKFDDYLKISHHIKSDNLRELIFRVIDKQLIGMSPKYVKITMFDSNSYHLKQAAKVLNKNLMYIAFGNTLGLSSYGIHFGLRDSMLFSKHICNLLGIVKYL